MKRKIIFLTLILVLVLATTALAQVKSSARPDTASSSPPGHEMLSGGHYHLTNAAWQVSSGGGYFLMGPAKPQLTGNGCCCTFLPCVRR